MKKLTFGLIAVLMFGNLSFGQNHVTLEVAKTIGELHNEFVAEGIENTPKTIEELKSNFMKIKVEGVSDEYKNDLIEFFASNDLKKQEAIVMDNFESQEAKNLFTETKNIVLNVKTFSQLSKDLDAKLADAEKLDGKDKEIMFTFIETSRSSLNFWLPKSSGGLGGGDNYAALGKINWGAIGYADGMGAVGALIRTFYLAAGGPLSWGAIVGAIGWGAAWGSGSALLWQLM